MSVRTIARMLVRTVREFAHDDALSLAGALAFYSALSLAPLLVLLIWASGSMGPETQEGVITELVDLIGVQASAAVSDVVNHARQHPDLGSIAGLISICVLIFSATTVFAHLQHSLNIFWDIKAKPGRGVIHWVRKRLLSLGLVLTVGFLLLVSLALSAGLSFAVAFIGNRFPGSNYLWQALDLGISLVIFAMLFAAIFKLLPDVRIAWKHVWTGALITSLLFVSGKLLIGIYLGRSSIGSAYGTAGSLVVLLVWVYYSSIILFFGAELTQVRARMSGADIRPERHARFAGRKPIDSRDPPRPPSDNTPDDHPGGTGAIPGATVPVTTAVAGVITHLGG